MSFYKLIFSPTGGTEKIADIIVKEWTQPVTMIDLSKVNDDFSKYSFNSEDVVLIAMPSFGGRLPAVAAERLSIVKGNSAKCVLVCVYGNRAYEDTLAEMEDIAIKCDFKIMAVVSAVAEHSIMRQYATGRPDERDTHTLADFSKQIVEKLNLSDINALKIPGNRPYKKAGSAGLIPKADKNCTKCKSCAIECPVGAIDPTDVAKTDKNKCISCMRCVTHCSQNARKANGALISVAALAIKNACSQRKEPELFI